MKKILFKILIASLGASGLQACSNDYLDDMTGEYATKAPVDCKISNLSSKTSVKDGAMRRHTLSFGTNGASTFSATFIGKSSDITLPGSTYTCAPGATAAVGNFTDASINGASVASGSITVKSGADGYSFSGLICDANGHWYRLASDNITLTFEPDPEPDKYFSSELTMQPCTLADQSIVPGVYKAGFSLLNEGGEAVAYFEPVVAESDTSLAGDYVLTEYASAAGQAANGYMVDLSMWGMGIMKGGSYVVADGKELYLNPGGTISISKNSDGTYKITGANLTAVDETGASESVPVDDFEFDNIQSLPQLPGATTFALTRVISTQLQNNVVTLKLGTDGFTVTAPDYQTTFEETYSGQGAILSVDVVTTDGTLSAGTYGISTQEESTPGTFIAGYDTTVDWGWGPMEMKNWGSCWFTVNDALDGKHISDGTLTIANDGTAYTITFEGTLSDNTAVKATYTGEITF